MSESNSRISRRDLFGRTSKAALAAAVAGQVAVTQAVAADAPASRPATDAQPPAKILNFHQRMKYRPLGETGMMLSEVSLGGHWKNRNGGRYWDQFSNDEVPSDVARNRTEVVSAALAAGVNYVDLTTAAECLSYGAALKGRRDKMYVGADDHRLGPRNFDNINVPTLTKNVEECLRRFGTDHLDIWRVQASMSGANTDAHVKVMIETAQRLKAAGKIGHFGISSHNRNWLKHVVEIFPEVEMIVFPCTARTRQAGQEVVKANVVEQAAGDGGKDATTSIFDAVRERKVGLVTIKPFAGGTLFKGGGNFPVMGVGLKEENDLARLTLQCILTRYDEITAVVPGLTTRYEVDNAARASYGRSLALSPAERNWLEQITDEQFAQLPQEYAWLREWDVI